MEDEEAGEQPENSKVPKQLRKYVFKKGVSGNPSGRPLDRKSLKTYAKEYLESMNEEERVEYLNGLQHDFVWKMAEGNPANNVELSGELTSKIIKLDE